MTTFDDRRDDSSPPDSEAQHDHLFARRLAEALRRPVKLDPGFDGRVVSRIRDAAESESPSRRRRSGAPWSRFPRLEMGSGRALALAASLMAAAFIGGVAFARGGVGSGRPDAGAYASGSAAATATDTVYVVRFILADPTARQVALVGSFNLWSEDANPLVFNADGGVWTTSVRLPPGVHEYAYVVDGEHWIADPLTTSMADPLGIETSILRLHANGHVGS
jgi:hypothetical protein